MKVDPQSVATGYRTSMVVGSTVVNEANETVGIIDDLIVTPTEKVPFAVLSVGGFLGMGTKYVVVPYSNPSSARQEDGAPRRHEGFPEGASGFQVRQLSDRGYGASLPVRDVRLVGGRPTCESRTYRPGPVIAVKSLLPEVKKVQQDLGAKPIPDDGAPTRFTP